MTCERCGNDSDKAICTDCIVESVRDWEYDSQRADHAYGVDSLDW